MASPSEICMATYSRNGVIKETISRWQSPPNISASNDAGWVLSGFRTHRDAPTLYGLINGSKSEPSSGGSGMSWSIVTQPPDSNIISLISLAL